MNPSEFSDFFCKNYIKLELSDFFLYSNEFRRKIQSNSKNIGINVFGKIEKNPDRPSSINWEKCFPQAGIEPALRNLTDRPIPNFSSKSVFSVSELNPRASRTTDIFAPENSKKNSQDGSEPALRNFPDRTAIFRPQKNSKKLFFQGGIEPVLRISGFPFVLEIGRILTLKNVFLGRN